MRRAVDAAVCDGCGEPPRQNAVDGGGTIPLRKCTRCRLAVYHDTACQRKHWQHHKKNCQRRRRRRSESTLRVEERLGRGKCLVAVDPIAPGQAILEGSAVQPLVPAVLFTANRQSHCAVCFGSTIKQKGSSANYWLCNRSKYPVIVCSDACQRASEPWLSQEVGTVSAVLDRYYANNDQVQILPTALLVYRVLKAIAGTNNVTWADVLGMQSHSADQDMDDSARAHQQAVIMLVLQMASMADNMTQMTAFMSENAKHPADCVLQILNRIKYNAFTVATDGNKNSNATTLGVALYEEPAHCINHSCKPNAVQSFVVQKGQLPQLEIHACVPIAPGEEVCVSYIDNNLLETPVQVRRQHLEQDYRFHCHCQRCKAEAGENVK